MPFQDARLKRYQVALAFVAVAVSFALGLLALELDIRHNARTGRANAETARRADRLAQQLAQVIQSTRELRAEQIHGLHAEAVASCRHDHIMVTVVTGILRRAVDEAKANPIPGATPAQQAAIDGSIRKGVASAELGIRQLVTKGDCTGVPPLPVSHG